MAVYKATARQYGRDCEIIHWRRTGSNGTGTESAVNTLHHLVVQCWNFWFKLSSAQTSDTVITVRIYPKFRTSYSSSGVGGSTSDGYIEKTITIPAGATKSPIIDWVSYGSLMSITVEWVAMPSVVSEANLIVCMLPTLR